MQGKFIVIDGTDGSGKATQTELLANRLKAAGLSVEVADFPQYEKKSSGAVQEYLNGSYGTAEEVGPYRASIFYAIDRYDASFQIRKWLAEGKVVISNRYVTANMGHQGGKIFNPLERKGYFDWLYKLEYGLFNIPKPDLNIILHVDAAVAQKLVDSKGARYYGHYAGEKKRDIHEADITHLRAAEKVYLEIAKNFPDFLLIECTRNDEIMPKDEISNLVWTEAAKLLNIKPISYAPDFKTLHEEQLPAPTSVLRAEKIIPSAKLPSRSHTTDAGLDLFSADYYNLLPNQKMLIQTGIKVAVPEGYVGLIWDKSGVAKDGITTLGGVIDSGYRGEIKVTLINLSQDIYHIAPGQKIAQLLLQKIELPEVVEEKLDDSTSRGNGGFGSTGLF